MIPAIVTASPEQKPKPDPKTVSEIMKTQLISDFFALEEKKGDTFWSKEKNQKTYIAQLSQDEKITFFQYLNVLEVDIKQNKKGSAVYQYFAAKAEKTKLTVYVQQLLGLKKRKTDKPKDQEAQEILEIFKEVAILKSKSPTEGFFKITNDTKLEENQNIYVRKISKEQQEEFNQHMKELGEDIVQNMKGSKVYKLFDKLNKRNKKNGLLKTQFTATAQRLLGYLTEEGRDIFREVATIAPAQTRDARVSNASHAKTPLSPNTSAVSCSSATKQPPQSVGSPKSSIPAAVPAPLTVKPAAVSTSASQVTPTQSAEDAAKRLEEAVRRAEDAAKRAEEYAQLLKDAVRRAEDAAKRAEEYAQLLKDAVRRAEDAAKRAEEDAQLLVDAVQQAKDAAKRAEETVQRTVDTVLEDAAQALGTTLANATRNLEATREMATRKFDQGWVAPTASVTPAVNLAPVASSAASGSVQPPVARSASLSTTSASGTPVSAQQPATGTIVANRAAAVPPAPVVFTTDATRVAQPVAQTPAAQTSVATAEDDEMLRFILGQ